MTLTTLPALRHEIYGYFGHAKDVLFNTVDALLTEDRAQSFPELSLSPQFERSFPSLYEAFADGQIDQQRLLSVFAHFLPRSYQHDLLWIGIE